MPAMLSAGERLFAYRFEGYWRDVGTVGSLWGANMDLLGDKPEFAPGDSPKILSRPMQRPAQFVGEGAAVSDSLISDGCNIFGSVSGSVLSGGVTVKAGARVIDSVIMEDATVCENAFVSCAIVGRGCVIGRGARFEGTAEEPLLVSGGLSSGEGTEKNAVFAYRDRYATKKI